MVQQAVRVGRGLDLFVTFGTLLVVTIPRLRNDSGALGNRKGEQANLGGYAGSFRWKREMMVGLVKSFSSSFSIFALSPHTKPQKENVYEDSQICHRHFQTFSNLLYTILMTSNFSDPLSFDLAANIVFVSGSLLGRIFPFASTQSGSTGTLLPPLLSPLQVIHERLRIESSNFDHL